MAHIIISQEEPFPLDIDEIKSKLSDFLDDKKVEDSAEVSVAVVGEPTMIELAQKYLGEENTLHNVLSFTAGETKKDFIDPPHHKSLGEIYICYAKVVEEAPFENKTTQEWANELVLHGALHLMGIHHK